MRFAGEVEGQRCWVGRRAGKPRLSLKDPRGSKVQLRRCPKSREEHVGGEQGSGLCHKGEVLQGMVDGPGGRGDQGRVGESREIRQWR